MKLTININNDIKETEIVINANSMNDDVEAVKKFINQHGFNRIIGKVYDDVILLNLNEVIRFYTFDKKVFAITTTNESEINKRLYELEEMLPNDFVRVSNTDIVNLKFVKRLDLSFKGTIVIELSKGSSVFVSRSYLSKVKKSIGL